MTDPLPGLRNQLVEAARRQHRRRAIRRRAATAAVGVAATAAVLFIGLGLGTSEHAEAGVEITVVGDMIQVELTDFESRPEFIEDALRNAGINATVIADPVSPSLVGRFLSGSATSGAEILPVEQNGQSFPGFRIPIDYEGPIELRIGRAAEPGEAYEASGDAYAPGEPLSCLGVFGTTLAEAATLVPDDVTVNVQPLRDGAPHGPRFELHDIDPDAAIARLIAIDGLAEAPDEVLLFANEEGVSPGVVPISPDRGVCRE